MRVFPSCARQQVDITTTHTHTLNLMPKRSATDTAAPQAKLCKNSLDTCVLDAICKMREKTLAHAMVLTFEEDNEDARCSALAVLVKLDPTSLAQHVPALTGCLNHDSRDVRCGALKVLEKLDPTRLVQHVPALIGCLNNEFPDVFCGALKVLEKLESAALAQHASVLGAALTRSRQSALTGLHNNPEFISWRRKLSCAWQSVSRRSG